MQHVHECIRCRTLELLRIEEQFLLLARWPETLSFLPCCECLREELVTHLGESLVVNFLLALHWPEAAPPGGVLVPFPFVRGSTKNQLPWAADFSAAIDRAKLIHLP